MPRSATGNLVRRAPSAHAVQSLAQGPGPTSHAAGVPVSECGRSEPSRGERTTTDDRAPPRGCCGEIFINQGGATRRPAYGLMELPDMGPRVSQPRGQMWQLM
jgi:hypothetical protein